VLPPRYAARMITTRSNAALLVTGASSGIGRAAALELAGRGHRVFLTGRDEARLHAAVAACESRNPGSVAGAEPVDLAVQGAGDRLVAAALDAAGELRGLLHAAGIGFFGPPEEHDDGVLARLMEANFFSATRVTRALLPHLRARGGGQLVFVLSVAAKRPFANVAGYCASKFALRGYAEALRQDLRGTGVLVTCALPVATRTPFWERAGYRNWEATHANTTVHDVETVGRGLADCVEAAPREWFPDLRSRVLDLGQRLTPGTIEWLNARAAPDMKPDFSGEAEVRENGVRENGAREL